MNKARQTYQSIKPRAAQLRDEYMAAKSEQEALRWGTAIENTNSHQRRARERQIKNNRRLKACLKPSQTLATKVTVTKADGSVEVCDTKSAIEKACIDENKQRFNQASNTPFMTGGLRRRFGFLATTKEADAICQGNWEPQEEERLYPRLLLTQVGQAESAVPNTKFTIKDHVDGWAKQKERTASEPSAPHFGHFKASARHDELAEIDGRLRRIPYETGFTPQSWTVMTDFQILKKAGIFDVAKMRTIQLFHPAFNMNNKKLGKDLMAVAERQGRMAKEQFGSRKGHKASTAALCKRVVVDVMRQKRQDGAICSNDAKSCYDRVVHSVASMAMVHAGGRRTAIKSMFGTLQQAQHRVRTAYGVSTRSYGNTGWQPMQGLAQGNGCGPAAWAAISSPIFDVMRARQHGARFISVLSGKDVGLVGLSFVDDADLMISQPGQTFGEVHGGAQQALEDWEGVLRATGGALVPAKSFWWGVAFAYKAGRWRMLQGRDVEAQLEVRDAQGTRTTLRRLELGESEQMLGVFMNMKGTSEAQVRYLRKKADDFADKVVSGGLSQEQVWMAITTRITKTLEYPMEAVTLSQKQWEFVYAPVWTKALPRGGVSRSFPRAVLYGPRRRGGIGMCNPWAWQLAQQLQTMAHEVKEGTVTGRLIELSIEQTKLETAGGGPLFLQSFADCAGHVTHTWVTQVWAAAQRFGVSITDKGPSVRRQQVGNVFLLDSWRNQGYSKTKKALLNECRLQLGITTLADMVTADGTSVMKRAYDGVGAGVQASPGWPRTPEKLSRRHWLVWQEWIEGLTEDRHLRLRRRLKAWLRSDRAWIWWWPDESRETVWRRTGRGFQVWRPDRGRQARGPVFRATRQVENRLPPAASRASVKRETLGGVVLGETRPERIGETLEPSSTIPGHGEETYWERRSVRGDISDRELRAAIRRGDVMAVSDGSFKMGFGASAYVLSVMDSGLQRTGCNVVPGATAVQSAYRSELAGVAGILRELLLLQQGGDLGAGPLVIGLDGMKAMENCRDGVAGVHQPSFDLLDHIRALRSRLSLAVRFRWVRGHQDDGPGGLDRWAVLNVHCDAEAKWYWASKRGKPRPVWRGEGSFGWQLRVGDTRSSWAAADTHDAIVGAAVDAYWGAKMSMTLPAASSIVECGRRKAFGRASWSQRLFVAKMTTGFIGVGRKLRQYGCEERCPWCGGEESTQHVVQCPRSGESWERCFQQYIEELEAIGTSGPLTSYIYASLRAHCGRSVRPDFSEAEAPCWWQVLMGWMPVEWGERQSQWFEEYGTGRPYYTVECWSRDAVLAGWRLVHGLWRARNKAKSQAAAAQARVEAGLDRAREHEERATGFDGWLRQDMAVAREGGGPGQGMGVETRTAWLSFVRAVRAAGPDHETGDAEQED